MKKSTEHQSSPRRKFLGNLVAGAAAFGLAGVTSPFTAVAANPDKFADDADMWFSKIKGKHRIAFDVPHANGIFPFAWPKVFLLTNEKTGTPAKDCNAVVIFRHTAIGYAMQNGLWEKYKFGEMFKADDPMTKAAATRNPFWEPKHGDFKVPGLGPVDIGINDLQKDGVMFCVCDMALTVFSAGAAEGMNLKAEDVKKEWVAGLLPGIQLVPSGVWAIGRAQEHGCAYCFAG